jgi:hypothetical protein
MSSDVVIYTTSIDIERATVIDYVWVTAGDGEQSKR